MWILWLLWITIVFGGLFMGLGAARVLLDSGFDVALALNAVAWLGCAAYGVPRLWRLIVTRSA